jgi:hypothetical protein
MISDVENPEQGRILQEIIIVLTTPYFIKRFKIKSFPDEVKNQWGKKSMKSV